MDRQPSPRAEEPLRSCPCGVSSDEELSVVAPAGPISTTAHLVVLPDAHREVAGGRASRSPLARGVVDLSAPVAVSGVLSEAVVLHGH